MTSLVSEYFPAVELTAEQKAEVLALLGRSRQQDLLFLQTVRDAALLAGEQVQDVRLHLLENPPGTETRTFLIEVLLSLALGPAAGALTKALTKAGMGQVLKSRVLAWNIDAGGTISLRTLSRQGVVAATRVVAELDNATRLLQRDAEIRRYWTTIARTVAGTSTDEAVKRAKAAAGADGATGPAPGGGLDGGDTASVAVRRAGLAFARQQELVTIRAHEELAARVQFGKVRLNDFTAAKEFLAEKLTPPNAGQLEIGSLDAEANLSLAFEAAIWVAHLQEPERLAQDWGDILKIPREYEALLSYFIRRFPHNSGDGRQTFLEFWTSRGLGEYQPPTIGFMGLGYARPDKEPVTPGRYGAKERAIIDLIKWFGTVARNLETAKRAYEGMVGFKALGPTRPKTE